MNQPRDRDRQEYGTQKYAPRVRGSDGQQGPAITAPERIPDEMPTETNPNVQVGYLAGTSRTSKSPISGINNAIKTIQDYLA